MYRMYGMPRCHGWQGAAMVVPPMSESGAGPCRSESLGLQP